MAHRFLLPADLLKTEELILPAPVAHQLLRVLRLQPGARMVLFCGDGRECEAVLIRVAGSSAAVRIETWRSPETELPCDLHVALAALKGEKLDWAVQKLTELGAARITLLRTERTVVAAGEDRWPRRLERYQRIAVEAAEQSGRVCVPVVSGPSPLAGLLAAEPGRLRIILDPQAARRLAEVADPLPPRLTVAIGPEGGFTEAEVRAAVEAGALAASLGPRTLRAETAAVAAAAVITCGV